ncbi:spindle assembly abnormal protein 6 homolog [Magallana gigas]|uniref:spindle assembly abnormal protein 6 homolog n=1 Tax=Magallana gigas TaxID=29159 RepID=UPI00334199F2
MAILEEKQDTLEKINSQILQELSSEEEIQMENRDSVEYMLHLRLKLAELTKSASSTKTLENVHQSTSINLNVNAQEFAQCNDMSQGNSGNPMTHYTVDKKDDNDIWDLQSLRRAVKVEPCIQDAGQASNLRSSQESQEFIPAANLVVGSSHKKTNKPQHFVKLCLFCNGKHSPAICRIIQDCEARISIIKEKRVCFNCLGKHKVKNCQSHFKCRICKKTHHTSICYKSQFLKPPSTSSVKNSERTKEKESHQLEQSIQLHYSKQLKGDRSKEEEKVTTTKETNKLNTKLQTAETRTNQTKKSAFNTVYNKEKEDQEQEDMVEKLKSEILQLRRENFKLKRKSSFKNHKIQKIQRENSDLEQKMKSLEDLNNQLQAQTQKTQSNVEPCSETLTTSQEMANKDTADLRLYLD